MNHSPPAGGSRLHRIIKTMRREKITFFKIFITVVILISFPITIILTNSSRNNRDIRSRAARITPTANKIIFVPFSFSEDQDNEDLLSFKKARIRNGFVPLTQTTTGPQYTATLMTENGQVLATQKFSLPQLVAVDSFDKASGKEKAELKKVSATGQGLVLPYHANASFIEIKNPKGEIVNIFSIANSSSVDNIINIKEIHGDEVKGSHSLLNLPINKAYAADGTFNIAIIGDNYNNDNLHFQNDVNDIAAGLLSIEPFKTYKSNIIFYPQLSTVPICTYATALTCNDSLAFEQASGLPYDKIYVLYNGPYAGYAYIGETLSYGTNTSDKSLSVKQGLFIHEMAGHTLGGLMDEYSYGSSGLSYAPNCSNSSACPSWSTLSGLGCFKTCGYTNLFRATDNSSVMNTALFSGTISFDQFSSQIVAGKLIVYFNQNPPTPTLPPLLPTPTITILPTTTPQPSITTQPTITSQITPGSGLVVKPPQAVPSEEPLVSITPSITIMPSVTITLVPSQPPSCSFPNFCTRGKLCAVESLSTISCAGSSLVCCKGQAQTEDTTPTITQKFELLPTVPAAGEQTPLTPSTTPIPTALPVPSITASAGNIQPTQQQNKEIALQTVPTSSAPDTNSSNPTPTNSQPAIPSEVTPTTPKEEAYLIYPTSTPFQVENIAFVRISPTPKPQVGIVDILAAPSRFINNIVKNLFSFLSGK